MTAAATEAAPASDPILVEVRRGDAVESFHRGAAAIMNCRGHLVAAWGDIDRPIFPRSAVKMIQALPLLESGAADRFRLNDTHIALACASHGGEPEHVQTVEGWLASAGLRSDMLECGIHRPFDDKSAQRLLAEGKTFTPLHHNCSGKHAGFLTVAYHIGAPLAGYVERSHPVQRMVTAAVSEITEYDLGNAPCGVDGCGIPAYALPLRNLAQGMANLARPDPPGKCRGDAARRITQAMMAQPWFVAGTGRFDTVLMTSHPSRFVLKMGAEGVHVAILPAAGLGIAVKIDDGARRAAELAMRGLLAFAGALEQEAGMLREPIRNHRGVPVGEARFVAPRPDREAEIQAQGDPM